MPKNDDINGLPINPYARDYPSEFIQTGISVIDGLNTWFADKTADFFGSGLPHNQWRYKLPGKHKSGSNDKLRVFAAMDHLEEAHFFQEEFRQRRFDRAVLFINLANDPTIERVSTPRMAHCGGILALKRHACFGHYDRYDQLCGCAA